MSEHYYDDTFSERFPGLYALWMGVIIGALSAVAVSSAIALSQFASDMPWKELLGSWGKMIVLTIPAFAGTFGVGFLAHHYRRTTKQWVLTGEPTLDASLVAAPKTAPDAITTMPTGSMVDVVVQNAKDQAYLHYGHNTEPTRREFEARGVSQTVWNSGRHILTTAKIVEGNKWSPEPWIVIEDALNTIHAEFDRVWVRPLGGRTMICLHVDEQATGKRYTSEEPPTPQQREPEYNQEGAGSAGSDGSWEPEEELEY